MQASIFQRLWDGYLLQNVPVFQDRLERIASRGMDNDQLYIEPKKWRELRQKQNKPQGE